MTAEDQSVTASTDYKDWRRKKIKGYMANNVDSNATDHSTIMTNAMHAEKALAYDLGVGICKISRTDIKTLRISADWRLSKGLEDDNPHVRFVEYMNHGMLDGVSVKEWASHPNSDGSMPISIIDRREHASR